GQIIILILFQVGGLGYMVLISSMVFFRRSRLSIGTRVLLSESVVRPKKVDILVFIKSIIIFTFVLELLGALALGYYWKQYFGTSKGFYEGFFHSVSAFCTAGFSLFSDSMTAYRGSIILNVIISVICITGGIGFFVLYDVSGFFVNTIRRKRPNRLSAYTKLAVAITALLILGGTLLIFISEKTGQPEGLLSRLLDASFQSVSSSTTTGFNTVDVGKMSQTGLLTIIVLMFIGAAPGGTGGGIKTTTFGLMILSLYAVLTGKEDVNVFRGRASPEAIRKAFSVAMAAVLWLLVSTLVLTATEDAPFLDIFFEATSALGTVGLSTGITPELSFAGKIIIAISMLIGRIGPLTIGFSLIGKPKKVAYQYPEAEILVG
ncbi:MAG: TrkH family potassium uptake protein, partial [Sedimentisphaerales bacterium]|nr:TrkH family potassium uptake protein [Sedimentisphaerales bacterium]